MLREVTRAGTGKPGEFASNSDVELVEKVRAGQQAAFEPIMRRYNRRLFRAARGVLDSDAEAEDALQDAYVSAYRHLDQFHGPDGLGAWLTRIAVNEALMRRRKLHSGTSADRVEFDDDTFLDTAMHDRHSAPPDEATENAQLGRLLEQCIDQLPSAYRTTFLLREVEGLSVAETAASLGIARATVKTRFHRARRSLRRTLSRELRGVMGDAHTFAGHRCDRVVAAVLRRLSSAPGSAPGSEDH